MIIGNWRPLGTAAAAGLFGFADALQLRDEPAVHSLLLFIAIGAAALAVKALIGGHRPRAAAFLIIGVATMMWYLSSEKIASEFVFITPYVTTLLVMAVAAQHLRPPAADGRPYRRGEST
jgi:simple sugar transport system permease protein